MELDQSTAEKLCGICGYCCDGTLFSNVKISAFDNVPAMLKIGIPIESTNDDHRFAQPCPARGVQCCKIYADRPFVCRSFRCKLLIEAESNTTTLATARERVLEVSTLKRAAIEALQRIEPSALANTSLRELRSRWSETGDHTTSIEIRKKYAPVLICMVSLAWYLEQYFYEEPLREKYSP